MWSTLVYIFATCAQGTTLICLVKYSFVIISPLEEDFEEGAVFAFLRTKELFSSAVITSLDKEASCTIATTPVTCQKKPIYRRFDGKCSNLKQPVAGGTGTALVRLEPAVSINLLHRVQHGLGEG